MVDIDNGVVSIVWQNKRIHQSQGIVVHLRLIVGFDHGLPRRVKNMARGTQ